MSSIVIQGDTSGSITVEAPSVAGTHTLTLPKATGNIATDATVGLGMKNRIINGNMVIDQRNAGASQNNSAGSAFSADRWKFYGDQATKFSIQQQTSVVPNNFTYALAITSLSAYTVGSGELFQIYQNIEGYNIADLGWGTAAAKTVTLSFWVRSSLTGTFGGSLKNSASNRSYPFTYTISSANTWEQKSITIAGDTTGTWATTTSTGIALNIGLGVGSTYSGTAGAWAAANYLSATGATSVVGTSGATFYITGVQLEVGENATPFENRMYGTELALCQRYYEKNYDINTAPATNTSKGLEQVAGTIDGNQNFYHNVRFAVPKRANPSINFYKSDGTANTWRYDRSGASNQSGTPAVGDNGDSSFYMRIPSTGATWVVATTGGFWTASAEL